MVWRILLVLLKSALIVAVFEFFRPVADVIGVQFTFVATVARGDFAGDAGAGQAVATVARPVPVKSPMTRLFIVLAGADCSQPATGPNREGIRAGLRIGQVPTVALHAECIRFSSPLKSPKRISVAWKPEAAAWPKSRFPHRKPSWPPDSRKLFRVL